MFKKSRYHDLENSINSIFIEYVKNKQIYEDPIKVIELIEEYSPESKEFFCEENGYHKVHNPIDLCTLIFKHFKLDNNKYKDYTFFNNYLILFEEKQLPITVNSPIPISAFANTYAVLIRPTRKVKSSYYPIFNLREGYSRNGTLKYVHDRSKPIDLGHDYDGIELFDHGYFKILKPFNGSNHRNAGILAAFGLLEDCSFEPGVIRHHNMHSRNTIDKVKNLILIINEDDRILSFEVEEGKDSYIIIFILNDDKRVEILFNKEISDSNSVYINSIYDFIISKNYDIYINFSLLLNIYSVRFMDSYISFNDNNIKGLDIYVDKKDYKNFIENSTEGYKYIITNPLKSKFKSWIDNTYISTDRSCTNYLSYGRGLAYYYHNKKNRPLLSGLFLK